MTIKKPLMRYQGAKWRLAPWIIEHFPAHACYVEPYGGSAAVLLTKTPSSREVYNDINDEVVTLFNVIRDDAMRQALLRLLAMTPYSRTEFEFAKERSHAHRDGHGKIENGMGAVIVAHKLLVRAQMTFNDAASRGRGDFRLDTSRPGVSLQELWRELPDNVLSVTERLRSVLIENTDAYNVIKNHDRKDTLFYLDPPPIHNSHDYDVGRDEVVMSEHEHEHMLNMVLQRAGMFVISGDDNSLYNDMLRGWSKHIKQVAAGGHSTDTMDKQAVLWLSPNCQQKQLDMFDAE